MKTLRSITDNPADVHALVKLLLPGEKYIIQDVSKSDSVPTGSLFLLYSQPLRKFPVFVIIPDKIRY